MWKNSKIQNDHAIVEKIHSLRYKWKRFFMSLPIWTISFLYLKAVFYFVVFVTYRDQPSHIFVEILCLTEEWNYSKCSHDKLQILTIYPSCLWKLQCNSFQPKKIMNTFAYVFLKMSFDSTFVHYFSTQSINNEIVTHWIQSCNHLNAIQFR